MADQTKSESQKFNRISPGVKSETTSDAKRVPRALAHFFSFLMAMMPLLARAQSSVELSRIGDAIHIEFSGQPEWKYDLNKLDGGQIVLRVPPIDEKSAAKLRSHSDSLVKSVRVNQGGVDGKDEIVFTTSSSADFFDYTTDEPSRLIVDFFPKEQKGPSASAAPAAAPVAPEGSAAAAPQPTAVVKTLPAKTAKAVDPRKPAGNDLILYAKDSSPDQPESLAEEISSKKDFSHGIFDGGDPEYKRFMVRDYEIKESAIIASKADFFLPFPMLELGNPQLMALINKAPTYEIVPQDSRENKEARVIHTLFTGGKPALFLKTAQEFLVKYPHSPYDEIINYMIADTHYGLWRKDGNVSNFETAMNLYLKMAERYPESPMTPRTHLLMGFSYVDRGDSIGALKAFQRFTRQNPNSKHLDRVNIFVSEAYLKLNRFDDAYAILDNIEKNGKIEKMRQEAAFRKGDVFFRKKDFAEAVNQYRGAIKRHPAAALSYPNAWYNMAESEFELRKHKESLNSYRTFLQKFPDHDHGGYAMTRIGELMGILGVDPKRSQGAYLESFFRYRATPGAGIARIRILTSRMPEMKEKELVSALREITEITEKYDTRPDQAKKEEAPTAEGEAPVAEGEKPAAEGEQAGAVAQAGGKAEEKNPAQLEDPTKKPLILPGIEDFSTLLISDAYSNRREFDTAVKNLVSFFQKNPNTPNKDRIKSRIARNVTEGIHSASDKGDFLDALRRYSGNSATWLKNSDRIDVRYYVGKSYEQAGVYQEASKIYQEVAKRLTEIKGTEGEKERQVFESLPNLDMVNLRLAAVATKESDFGPAETYLKNTDPKGLKDQEKVERVELAAQVSEARGQVDAAERYMSDLIKTWKGEPGLTSPLHLRIARIQKQARKFAEADQHIGKILEMRASSGSGVSDDVHAQALEMRGDLMVSRGKRKEAVAAYQALLDQYESKRPLASVRYRMGQVLYDDGDLKGAEMVWAEIKPEASDKTGNLWQRLASEKLQGAKWNKEYKKYLDRIPAAADLRDGQSSKSR